MLYDDKNLFGVLSDKIAYIVGTKWEIKYLFDDTSMVDVLYHRK